MATQWGIRQVSGAIFECRDERHATGMMQSTSPIIGPMEGREIVTREVTPWKVYDPPKQKES